MKTAILSIFFAIYCLSAVAQKYDPNWDIKIRDDSYYGIALSGVKLLEMATDDAKELSSISPYDSVQFVHEMNGFWYVFTDKGAEGYVKDLRYRTIDLDSIKMAPILAEKARLLALEQARQDSIRTVERITKAYALFDSVTARRLLDKNLWVGMTKEMALISIGEPNLVCNPDVLAPCVEAWNYPETELQFQDGYLAEFYGVATETDPEEAASPITPASETEAPAAPTPDSAPEPVPATMPDITDPNPTGSVAPVTPANQPKIAVSQDVAGN